jgi:flagellum-specific ATP synthase
MRFAGASDGLLPSHELEALIGRMRSAPLLKRGGRVLRCSPSALTCAGLGADVGLNDCCWIERAQMSGPAPAGIATDAILGEIVALGPEGATVLAYEELAGVRLGAKVSIDRGLGLVRPHASWQGRVLDAMGEPIDDRGPLQQGERPYPLQARALAAHRRGPMGPRLGLGVRALDLFTPCCEGQRLGVFAGSGVGKSSLLSMIARASEADLLVIGLIGERGRELHDFLHTTLGEEGRRKSIVVVATSDTPAMLRRRAAYLTLAIAEAARDRGLRVLCMLDSVTRFAMALREIYLAAGEPPTTKGYPPGVFSELPRLLERAGPGEAGRTGSITGLFAVLVEGDDTSEPVADTVRGILDGHIMLDRRIAERGRFPAVDVLRSISRAAPGCYAPDERELVGRARRLLAAHAEMAELVQLGAYRAGSDPLLDEAIARLPGIEAVLEQPLEAAEPGGSPFSALEAALTAPAGTSPA